MKIIVKVKKSQKGHMLSMLMVDLGYRKSVISWDSSLCAEMLETSVKDLLSQEHEVIIYDSENPEIYEL